MLVLRSPLAALALSSRTESRRTHLVVESNDDDIEVAVTIRGFNATVYKCIDI